MESFKKSFKSQTSYNSRHGHRLSSGGGGTGPSNTAAATSHEELPILSDIHLHADSPDPPSCSPADITTRRSAPAAGTGAGSKVTRDSSVEFWRASGGEAGPPNALQDPPSRLIGQFLQKQSHNGGEVALDMDLEMDELSNVRLPPSAGSTGKSGPICSEQSKDTLRVSFEHLISSDTSNSSSGEDSNRGSGGEEVARCTSNRSFQPTATFMKAKTRSRLIDPQPEEYDRRSGQMSGRVLWSGQFRSGGLGKPGGGDEDEDDLFLEEDMPEEYKKAKFNTLTLLQWVSLILIIALLIVTLAVPTLKRRHIWKLQLWKWEVVILVLICGRLVSGWGIKLIVFFIERNFVLRKKLLYFVYGVRKAVQNCLWLGLVVIAWESLLDKKVEKETNDRKLRYVTRVLLCLMVGFILWLIKTLIIKVLASSFHVSTYFDRIQESLFSQFVIETLSGLPQVEIEEDRKMAAEIHTLQESGATVPLEFRAAGFPPTKSGRMRSPSVTKSVRHSPSCTPSRRVDDIDGIQINHIHKLNQKNVSAWKMKRLMKIVRHGVLSTLGEQINNTTDEDESAHLIRSENEAKAAARKIFQNVAKPRAKYIYLDDLMRFMTEDEALRTMYLCEGAAETKRISKRCLKNWLVGAFRDRKALALTLNDTKTAVDKLHRVANVIAGIIILVIWLLILGIATSKSLVYLTSELLLVAFIFGNTCKTIFESIIFLFVMHPFDVGDRCEVDGVQMIVEEMDIMTTIFLRYDNQKIMYPNSVLSQKAIGNYYRSPDMGDAVEFYVHLSTPAEKIALMKQKIINYIECKKEHWSSSPMVIFKDVEDLNRVKIAVWLSHKMNHQNMGERWARRALLLEEMVKIMKELDIQYRMLPLDINVRSLPPATTSRLPPTWVGNN
ncbi:mechanosensitive ion channel protein 6-like [Punica granatum]|uniref:Mechanosensitive ion channel protein n=2 Tax=Punica granatum TaxID=22663 RepID=A0A6P8CKR5_PUNGR|nr:mechanosensitive ion channel protein 6-like [Punica granatum]